MAYGSGVTVKDGLDIGSEQAAQLGNALNELLGYILGATWKGLMKDAAYVINLV